METTFSLRLFTWLTAWFDLKRQQMLSALYKVNIDPGCMYVEKGRDRRYTINGIRSFNLEALKRTLKVSMEAGLVHSGDLDFVQTLYEQLDQESDDTDW